MGDEEPELGAEDSWIGVVPLGEEPADGPRGAKEESFTAAVVSKVSTPSCGGSSWGPQQGFGQHQPPVPSVFTDEASPGARGIGTAHPGAEPERHPRGRGAPAALLAPWMLFCITHRYWFCVRCSWMSLSSSPSPSS